MSRLGAVAAACLLAGCASAPRGAERTDPVLQAELERLAAAVPGVAGAYVRHLPTGRSAAVRADEDFPSASLVKLPILAALFARLERGELDYNAPLAFDRSRVYPGDDLLGSFRDGERVSIARLTMLMLTMSTDFRGVPTVTPV